MRPILLVALVLLPVIGCKSRNPSELQATDSERQGLKTCIQKTVLALFPEAADDKTNLERFADEWSRKAAYPGATVKDPKYDDYLTAQSCDPNQVAQKYNFGTTIAIEWSISPWNRASGATAAKTTTLTR